MDIVETQPGHALWPQVALLVPDAAGWNADPEDGGDYRFLAAVGETGEVLGATATEIGTLLFGPLGEVPAGFLEDLEVREAHRRQGVGSAPLRAILDLAWDTGCESVRSNVDYDNPAALALYRKQGLGFIPEEDPDADDPQSVYATIAINPARVEHGYGSPS